MDKRYFLTGSANDHRNFHGDLDEVLNFPFKHLQLALLLRDPAELTPSLPAANQPAVYCLGDVKHRISDGFQSIESSALLAEFTLAVREVELLIEQEMPQL